MRSLLPLACLLLPLATASCADEATVNVKYVEGYRPARASLSVLGVFRDGRMSAESWAPIGTPLAAALGVGEACEPAFGERLLRENEELFTSIDQEVRESGVTEDLLARLAPRAQGDFILTITVHGSVGQQGTTTEHHPASGRTPAMAPPMRGGSASRGPRGGNYRESPMRGAAIKPLELSASLYSIKKHAPVARLQMSYTGTSTEEALKRFTTEIGAMAPGSACRGWSITAPPPAAVAPLLEGP